MAFTIESLRTRTRKPGVEGRRLSTWVIVVVAMVVATGAALIASFAQSSEYSSTSIVLVGPRAGEPNTGLTAVTSREIETEVRLIEQDDLRGEVASTLGMNRLPERVDARPLGDTNLIELHVRSSNATNAAILAETYAQVYVQQRTERDATDSSSTPDVTVLGSASAPASSRASLGWALPLSTGAGLLIGVAGSWVLARREPEVQAPSIEDAIDRRVIGRFPPMSSPTDGLVGDQSSVDLGADALIEMRTNVQRASPEWARRVIQVTGCGDGVGATTIASILAILLARAGNRVALVDADLRDPSMHRVFGFENEAGLTEMILGTAPKDVARVVEVGNGHRVTVYTAGLGSTSPSELLGGRRLQRLVEQMGEHYDHVIIDTASVAVVPDALVLSSMAHAVVLVVDAERSTVADVDDALHRLDVVAAPLLGLVVNRSGDRPPASALA